MSKPPPCRTRWSSAPRSLLAGLLIASSAAHAGPPNILLILTDDQGYGDLGCHGNPILRTPEIDRFHAQSVRFRQFQVSPTCSPTRSALLTGRHEFRNGVTHTIYERERLTLEARTLPELLQEAGYETAIFGKWHLGDEDAYQPEKRGFDEVFIHGGGGIGQSYPGSCGDAPGNTYDDPWIRHNGAFVQTKGYCTDVFFGQAIRWIQSREPDKPFFIHLALNAPHTPLNVPPAYEEPYRGRVPDPVARFFGMIANIDENVGRLVRFLDETGLSSNTLVVYMSDNGGTTGVEIFDAGLRGRKGTAWQGGTRALSLWRWTGTLVPADVGALTAHVDFMPTLLELAGVKLTGSVREQIEGRSLLPLLKNPASDWPDRTLVTHVGRWQPGQPPRKFGECSIRNQRFSLVRDGTNWQLFDLAADPGERRDLSATMPDQVRDLSDAYDVWWTSVVPALVNEEAFRHAPSTNPFVTAFRQQQRASESRGEKEISP